MRARSLLILMRVQIRIKTQFAITGQSLEYGSEIF